MRILTLGDVFGEEAAKYLSEKLFNYINTNNIDFTIANCENGSGASGVEPQVADRLLASGCDVLTGGNHSLGKASFLPYLSNSENVLRPANYPNTVPGSCTFRANVRFATMEQLEWMREHVKKIAADVKVPGCTTTVDIPAYRPAMEYTEKNADLLARMNRIFVANGMTELKMKKCLGGSDAAYTTIAGIPTVENFGAEGDNVHSEHEWAYLRSLDGWTKRIAAVIVEI